MKKLNGLTARQKQDLKKRIDGILTEMSDISRIIGVAYGAKAVDRVAKVRLAVHLLGAKIDDFYEDHERASNGQNPLPGSIY